MTNLRERIDAGEGLTNAQARQVLAIAQGIVDDLFWELTERMTALIEAHPSVLRRPF